MHSWYALALGDALTAHLDIERLRGRLAAHRKETGTGADLPVYLHHDNTGGLHCEVTVYFAPALAELARELGAAPCEGPPTAGLQPLLR
jgi:hypothetical protein